MAFLDDLGAKLTRAGQITKRKANELGDTAKMNMRTNELNRANQGLYSRLGEAYYALKGATPDPELSELCDALTKNLMEMENIRQELQRIRQVQTCPNCGAQNPPDARFCSSCSAPLIIQPEQGTPTGRICPNCGNAVGENAMFCTYCGTRLTQPDASFTPPAPDPYSVPDPDTFTAPAPEPPATPEA